MRLFVSLLACVNVLLCSVLYFTLSCGVLFAFWKALQWMWMVTLITNSHCRLPISALTGCQRIFTLSRRSLRQSWSAGWKGCWGNVRRKKNWRSGSRGFDWWVVRPNMPGNSHIATVLFWDIVDRSNTEFCASWFSHHEWQSRMCSKDFLSYQGDAAHFSSFCSVSGDSPAEIELLASLPQCNDFVWSQSGREEMLAHTANGNLFPNSKPGVKSQGRLFM